MNKLKVIYKNFNQTLNNMMQSSKKGCENDYFYIQLDFQEDDSICKTNYIW